jgi:hypothetical protein
MPCRWRRRGTASPASDRKAKGGADIFLVKCPRPAYRADVAALPDAAADAMGQLLAGARSPAPGRYCPLRASFLQLRASLLSVCPNFARPPSKPAPTAPDGFGAGVRPTACSAWTCADSAFPLIAVCISKTRHWRARKCPQKKQGPPGTRVTQLLARPPVNACWPVPGSIAPRTRVLLSLILRLPGAVKAWERNRR